MSTDHSTSKKRSQAGKPKAHSDIPRGIEVLIKKAAIDQRFKSELLQKRAEAALTIGLQLDATEIAMINSIPADQLVAIIDNTKVSSRLREAFLGYAAAVMLAALGCEAYASPPPDSVKPTGINPDLIPEKPTTIYWTDPASGARVESATLTGTVRSQSDVELGGVSVDLIGDAMSIDGELIKVNLTTYTDSDGFFSFSPAPCGKFSLAINDEDYLKQERKIDLKAGSVLTVTFTLIAASTHNVDGGCRPDLE